MIRIIAITLLLILSPCCRKDKKSPEPPANRTTADFLKDAYYNKLVVQIIYVTGMKPEDGTISNLSSFLQSRLNKPAGIEIVFREIPPQGKPVLSVDDIRAIESQWRSVSNNGTTLSASILYLEGEYDQNSGSSKVLGVAYGFSSMAVFEKTIREFSGGLAQPSRVVVESSVTNHEFGHIIGLVNNGTPMAAPHQDIAHGRHCDNKSCLMYYATETSDIINNLIGGNVPQPDANCVADLRSAGGK
jgi:hypothetical protein